MPKNATLVETVAKYASHWGGQTSPSFWMNVGWQIAPQGVFCQSAIENAQKDHAAVVQNILDNKDSQFNLDCFLRVFLHVHQTLMQSRAHLCPDKEAHLKKIRALFSKLGGTEEAGAITYDMLEEHIQTTAVREYFDSLGLDVSDAWSFFKLLDSDGGTKG